MLETLVLDGPHFCFYLFLLHIERLAISFIIINYLFEFTVHNEKVTYA